MALLGGQYYRSLWMQAPGRGPAIRLDAPAKNQRERVFDQLRVCAACPPDRTVTVRGGCIYASAYWGPETLACIPTAVCDFTDPDLYAPDPGGWEGAGYYYTGIDGGDNTTWTYHAGWDGKFDMAGYFRGVIITIPYYWYINQIDGFDLGHEFYLIHTLEEYSTAAETEAVMLSWYRTGTGVAAPYIYPIRTPLAVLILKNNGTTGVLGEIEPVDAVNRGRSYIWRDARVRHKYTNDAD